MGLLQGEGKQTRFLGSTRRRRCRACRRGDLRGRPAPARSSAPSARAWSPDRAIRSRRSSAPAQSRAILLVRRAGTHPLPRLRLQQASARRIAMMRTSCPAHRVDPREAVRQPVRRGRRQGNRQDDGARPVEGGQQPHAAQAGEARAIPGHDLRFGAGQTRDVRLRRSEAPCRGLRLFRLRHRDRRRTRPDAGGQRGRRCRPRRVGVAGHSRRAAVRAGGEPVRRARRSSTRRSSPACTTSSWSPTRSSSCRAGSARCWRR